ncbi:MAG: preprotein translocase subunit SecG [bacterium]
MNSLVTLLPYIQIALAIVLIVAIMIQKSEAGVGGSFGGSDNFNSGFHSRRGFERILFISTIIIGILFAVSALVALFIAR